MVVTHSPSGTTRARGGDAGQASTDPTAGASQTGTGASAGAVVVVVAAPLIDAVAQC
jgi:hypothetical protein